jgi:CheY-like chemotaxis protein
MESLGVLAGGVAHDFNNLLMGVLGNAELALMDLPKHSTVRSYIKDVIKAAQRAADLSRQMLAYSGQGRLEIEAVDMTDLISEMSSLLGASVGRQAEIVCDLEEGLPSVEGDSTQLRQVIMNLVINAAEAMENSMGVITVSTNLFTSEVAFHAGSELEEELPAGDYLCLQVRDTGCGMDETTASRIFDPFFTTKFTGRGLGLASVLGIVRGHNGGVRVFSAPGKGSTISVYLPIIPESANQISRMLPAASLELNVLHAGGWHGSGTVLFVDDEELVRVVGRQILEKAGFNVITTCTGVEAIEVLQGNPDAIDCVLLDLTMPGMDGVETCYRMKMLRPDLPVILASGYHEQELARRYSDAGFSEFIQKPFTVESLISRLRNVLQ